MIAADTKQYLYLDPGRLIQSAISMWNPDIAAGTVTHQNIGFLFPMGPYYWVVQQLHIPMWVGQRFWMGSLFFLAGSGAIFLARLLGLDGWGAAAAGVTYALTPYVIDYIARISAIVMPWSALGWMVGFVILAVRRGGWRYPALFAVVIALVGGVNATSILLAGLAPVLWILYALAVTREVDWRRALRAVGRLGVLTVAVSLWWIAGLWAEGTYGINVLKFTETLPTVTSTSLSSEVVRGLGYWYFYGQDKLQPWTTASLTYTQSLWLILVSFSVPALCIIVGALARWRYKAFAIALVLLGVTIAVGAYPFDHPSPIGALAKAAGSDSTVGLAMRSSNRVVPLVVLGFALLLGSGLSAIIAARRTVGLGMFGLAVALVATDLPPLWTGNLVADNLARPSALPSYITEAAAYLNAHGGDTRVLQEPGEDFAYYRWGVTSDPVWPGLLNRPFLERQVVPAGEPASVNLLQALDESIQDGVFVPSTLAPIARLFSVGDLLFESDLQYERFDDARPQPLWLTLDSSATPGLGKPVTFGKPEPVKTIKYPLQDETQLAIPTGAPLPPPVAVFPVPHPRPIVRAEPTADPLVIAGDGQGLLNAAAAGLLDSNPTIFYSASYAKNHKGFEQLMADGATLVLTDTNQRQRDTWGSTNDNYGYVEQAHEKPLGYQPSEVALPAVPGAPVDTQTVTVLTPANPKLVGIASVRATAYGNPITNTPEDRAFNAVDGNPQTAWTEGAFSPGTGATLEIDLDRAVRASQITLLQPQTGNPDRWITQVTLRFDGHHPVTETLSRRSLVEPGQVVRFPARTFRRLDLTVDATSVGVRKTYEGMSGVGFAEVSIPGVSPAIQTLAMPSDLLDQAGTASLWHPLDILMNRLRAPVVPPRSDPELTMRRSFRLPTARSFSVGGIARISPLDPDQVIAQLTGTTAAPIAGAAEVVAASSSGRLPGDLRAGADAAIDDNPKTAWMPGFGKQVGNWLSYTFSRPITLNHLNLQVVTDGRHSVPTKLTISTENGSRTVRLPMLPMGNGRPQGSTSAATVSFPPLTGRELTVTIDAIRPHRQLNYYSNRLQTSPVGIAELGIPGVSPPTTPSTIPSNCYSDLLTIDGKPIDVSISGPTNTALDNGGLVIRGCGNAANGITLSAGTHIVQTAGYQVQGLTIDSLWLSSAAGGAPLPLTSTGTLSLDAAPGAAGGARSHSTSPQPSSVATSVEAPRVTIVHQDRTAMTVRVAGDGHPFWLVLGQSQSAGWHAKIVDGPSLGSSRLIDGYANGWLVPGTEAPRPITIALTWTPQHVVNLAILASAVGLGASVALALLPSNLVAWANPLERWRRRRGRAARSSGTNQLNGNQATTLARRQDSSGSVTTKPVATSNRQPDPALLAPERPTWPPLFKAEGESPGWLATLCWAAVSGGLAALITAPIAAPFIAAVVVLGLRLRWTRLALVFAPGAFVLATGVYVAVEQARYGYVPDITWPAHFPAANTLTWIALCLLGALGITELARLRPWRKATIRPPMEQSGQ